MHAGAGLPSLGGQTLAVEPDDVGPLPGEPGWYGPRWEHDEVTGALLPSVSVVSFPGDGDQWIQVHVVGLGLDFGWSEGPYESQVLPFSVPIDLPPDAHADGLVAVFVRVRVTDAETGALRSVEQTPAAYVIDAGLAGEAWFDEATAKSRVVRDLPAGTVSGENEELDGLVGLEVSR